GEGWREGLGLFAPALEQCPERLDGAVARLPPQLAAGPRGVEERRRADEVEQGRLGRDEAGVPGGRRRRTHQAHRQADRTAGVEHLGHLLGADHRLGREVERTTDTRASASQIALAMSAAWSAWNRRSPGHGRSGSERSATTFWGRSHPAKIWRCSSAAPRWKMKAGRNRTTRIWGFASSSASTTRST